MRTYKISRKNINKLLSGNMITGSQANILGYAGTDDLKKGWIRSLNGILGKKNQLELIKSKQTTLFD